MSERQITLAMVFVFVILLATLGIIHTEGKHDLDLLLSARIKCPKCEHEFRVEKTFIEKLKEKL